MFKRKAKEPKIKKPRFQTFRDAYKVTKQVKPWIPYALIGIFLVSWSVGIAIGSALGETFYFAFVFLVYPNEPRRGLERGNFSEPSNDRRLK